jgi:glycosyltransferase involved in cell wall biosynthesis
MNGDGPLAVVIPTYNEAHNIRALAQRLRQCVGDLQIVVVDDNSPDGTGAIAEELRRDDPAVHVVHRPAKLGLGSAYVAGIGVAMDFDCTAVLTMDADLSHRPEHLPRLVAAAETYDVVIGSRYVEGGSTRGWGLHRRILSRTANGVARTALGLQVRDCTAGFRCYRRRVLETLELERIRSNGYAFLVEMIWLCARNDFSIGEVPIVFEDRLGGQSKMSSAEIRQAIRMVARLSGERVRPGRSATPPLTRHH